jgi:hypothetical protein
MRIVVREAPIEIKVSGMSNGNMPGSILNPGSGKLSVRVLCTCVSVAGGKYSRIGNTESDTAVSTDEFDQFPLGVYDSSFVNLDEISRTTFDGDWIFSADIIDRSSLGIGI